MENAIRGQYELHPYPPIPFFALPSRHDRANNNLTLSYEAGTRIAYGTERSHRDKRILVAGAGTFEALMVGQVHPEAAEVIAVDLSEASLSILRRRIAFARIVRGRRSLPPIQTVRADLMEWEGTGFDYIVCSNVAHHVESPATLLSRMAKWLAPEGLIRLVTYPRASRIWMRSTGHWLKLHCLTPRMPGLCRRAREVIRRLPESHPIRSCFQSQPETGTTTGIVDAFLHACENPLRPMEWAWACADAGLTLAGESQTASSQSSFLETILPETRDLTRWEKLQILDDLLEICANPVLWLRPGDTPAAPDARWTELSPSTYPRRPEPPVGSTPMLKFSESLSPEDAAAILAREALQGRCLVPARIPSAIIREISEGVRRVDAILSKIGLRAEDALRALRQQVGPRVEAHTDRVLPGLSILHYIDLPEARPSAPLYPKPWGFCEWRRLEKLLSPRKWTFTDAGLPVPGSGISQQAEWIQLRFGAEQTVNERNLELRR